MSNVGAPIAAIPTRYAGCHFRSRLEARWAVFFDHLGIRWEYEPQGYTGHNDCHYLPDFHLPELGFRTAPGVYVEVKGTDDALHADSDSYRLGMCIDWGATPVADGLLILGDIPRPDGLRQSVAANSILFNRKGVQTTLVTLECRRTTLGGEPRWRLKEPVGLDPLGWFDGNVDGQDGIPTRATTKTTLWPPPTYVMDGRTYTARGWETPQEVIAGYAAARSARFEHGQSGAT